MDKDFSRAGWEADLGFIKFLVDLEELEVLMGLEEAEKEEGTLKEAVKFIFLSLVEAVDDLKMLVEINKTNIASSVLVQADRGQTKEHVVFNHQDIQIKNIG